MGLDIRLPLGLLFASVGLLLMIYGWLGAAPPPDAKLAVNLNLWWGLVMLIFGASMLVLSRRHSAAMHSSAESPEGRAMEKAERDRRLESPEGA
jgi:hypothetical protein